MGVFYVFKIALIVPNRTKRRIIILWGSEMGVANIANFFLFLRK